MVENDEILNIVRETIAAGEDPSLKLIEKANENGGKDNIATVVVQPFSDEVNIC
ncbi:MAG TPA: serine/threonine-protein phosphatase, partial [Candidatus Alectryocaccobium stercorigallinarum]|nr:serine/threonine-protein phosphatase [Candidatus Alectryocaccobium stercorigallinarum]